MRLSEAEWRVMNAIWWQHPATAREVLERVEAESPWAYTTVKTILSRLVDKGALGSQKRANTLCFSPLITKEEARLEEVDSLLDRAFDGAFGPLLNFLMETKTLSKKDRRALERLLEKDEGRNRDVD